MGKGMQVSFLLSLLMNALLAVVESSRFVSTLQAL